MRQPTPSRCRPSRRWRSPQEDSPVFLPGAFQIVRSVLLDEPKIRDAFKSGRGRRLARAQPLPLRRHRAILPTGLLGTSRQRVDSRARRRGGKTPARREASPTSAAATAPRPSSWPRPIRNRASIGFDYHEAVDRDARAEAARTGRRRAIASPSRAASAKDFPGTRLRSRHVLRLPARHGRPGRRGRDTSARRSRPTAPG